MNWSDVEHQDAAMRRVDQALRAGRLPHAYIFAGPEGVGKRMAAVRLARRLLCSGTPAMPDQAADGVASEPGGAAARRPEPAAGEPAFDPATEASIEPTVEPVSDEPSLFGGDGGLFAAPPAPAHKKTAAPPKPAPARNAHVQPKVPWSGCPDDACGQCDDCAAVAAGAHVDLHLIDRGLRRHHPNPEVRRRQGLDLGVDIIRHFVTDRATRCAARGRAKVFIIDEAERMNDSAANALLKTLEEPPGDAFLILIVPSVSRLLPTIRSRCQIVEFRRLPDDFLRRRLIEQARLAERDAAYLAGLADGRLGTALQYAAAGLHQQREPVLALLHTAREDPLEFSRAAQAMLKSLAATDDDAEPAEDGEDEDEDAGAAKLSPSAARDARLLMLAMIACALRDALHRVLGLPPQAHRDAASLDAQLAAGLDPRCAARAIRAVSAAEADLARQGNVALVFDVLGLQLSRAFNGRPAVV